MDTYEQEQADRQMRERVAWASVAEDLADAGRSLSRAGSLLVMIGADETAADLAPAVTIAARVRELARDKKTGADI